jgi:hypothetical protein
MPFMHMSFGAGVAPSLALSYSVYITMWAGMSLHVSKENPFFHNCDLFMHILAGITLLLSVGSSKH